MEQKDTLLLQFQRASHKQSLTAAINASKPEIVCTVPYVLKLLAESDEGIEALKRCSIVSSSGSRCPDELGDMLTERGVFLGCLFGSCVFIISHPFSLLSQNITI